jgi:phage repressor protein C with HTH and peptisase S24 domain
VSDNQVNNILERFRYAIDYFGLKQKDLEKKTKIKQSQISECYKGTRNITDGIKVKLEDGLGVSRKWLDTGEGDMILKESVEKTDSTPDDTIPQNDAIKKVEEEDFEARPVIGIAARASFVESFINESPYEPMSSFPVLKKSYGKELYVVEVSGNSMEPELRDKDKILVRNYPNKNDWVSITGIAAVIHNGFFTVKRILENDLAKDGTLTLVSDNPLGGNYKVNQDDIFAIMTYEDLVSRVNKR